MKQEVLSQFPHVGLVVAAMFLFIAVFTGIALWAWRRSARAHYERMARLPLDERSGR